MKINMKTERLLEDGTQLEPFNGIEHGWSSVKAGTDALCQRWGNSVKRLSNGYQDKAPNPATGVRLRVTFTELAV